MAEKALSVASVESRMRAEGRQIYESLMRGDKHNIQVEVLRRGADVTQSQSFGYVKLEEIRYTAGDDRDNTWIRLAAPGGVRTIPILNDGEGEKIIMAFMPRPAIEQWSLELVAGYLKSNETYRDAAAREILEETGYEPGSLRKIATFTDFPARKGWRDEIFVAESLTFKGRTAVELEERPIKVITLTIPEIEALLDENRILCGGAVAALYTHLRSRSKLSALKR